MNLLKRGLAHHAVKNMIGAKFGALTVLNICQGNSNGHKTWFCKCDCGTERICVGVRLQNGSLKYCSRKCPMKPKPKYVRPCRFKPKSLPVVIDQEKQNNFLAQFLGSMPKEKQKSNFRFHR